MPPNGNPRMMMHPPEPRHQGHARWSKEPPPQRRKHASRSCPVHPKKKAAALWPPPLLSSRHVDVVVLQRERADALAGRREVGVEHGRRRHRDGRLADAAPETTGWHHDLFHLRHFGYAHRVVDVEILLLDAPVL